jgi:hypothetical protein
MSRLLTASRTLLTARRRGLAALVAAAVLAGLAGPAATTAPAGAAPGGTVPGLTGPAAARAVGAAGPRFGALQRDLAARLAAGRQAGAAAPADTLHADWGIIPTTVAVGAQATQSVNPSLATSTSGGETLYTPTLMPGRTACIELSTIYWQGTVQVGAWDWCAASPGFAKVATVNSTFTGTYTTTVHGRPAYTAKVYQTNATSNSWTAYLYNQKTKVWDTFFTSTGTTKLSGNDFGWDIWEIYANTNPATGQAYYCADAKGTTWESSSVSFSYGAGSWTPATPATTWLTETAPAGTDYRCPRLKFAVAEANDDISITDKDTPATPAWPLVQQGNTGERVKTVQYLLNQHGASLDVDGDFGSATLAAVKSFQSANGLGVDGLVGANTWSALAVTVSAGSTGDAVRAAQSQLTAHHYAATVSGTFDAATTTALRSYQNATAITVNATVNATTWRFLVA